RPDVRREWQFLPGHTTGVTQDTEQTAGTTNLGASELLFPFFFLEAAGIRDLADIDCFRRPSGVNLLEWLDDYRAVYTGGLVGVGLGPLLGGLQRLELGNHQTAGKAGSTRVIAVDGRVRAGQNQAAFALELIKARQMGRTRGQALL